MLDLERDRCYFEAKSFDMVCILVIHGLRILVCDVGVLMALFIVCAVIALGVLIEVLNR